MLPRIYARALGTALAASLLAACGWQLLNLSPVTTIAHDNGSLLRLHVVANSDSPGDQELKLAVRDALIPLMGQLLLPRRTAADAEAVIRVNEGVLVDRATAVIREAGMDYPVRVEIGNYSFPSEASQRGEFPAGEYRAMRVVIGAGKGRNWWCVLFPPLCFAQEGAVTEAVPIAVKSVNRDGVPVEIRMRVFDHLTHNRYARLVLRIGRIPLERVAWLNSVEARGRNMNQ